MKWQNHLGLDLGMTSGRLVQLSPEGNKFRLLAAGRVEIPKTEDKIGLATARVEAIKKLVRETKAGARQVVVSLPESQIYTRVVEMPYLEEPELSQAINWQAEQYIPVPLTDVVLKHKILSLPETGTPGARMSVLLVAAPNEVLNVFMSACSAAGLEVVAVDTEVLASLRILTFNAVDAPRSLLIHIGHENTIFCLYKGEMIFLIQSVATGGQAITRAIASQLGLDEKQAEEYKRSYGLDTEKLEGKVAAVVKPAVDAILGEASRVLASFETHPGGGNEPVKRAVLSGGGSIIPQIVPYVTTVLGLEAQLANPFSEIITTDVQKRQLAEVEPIFSVAAGLALKPV